MMVMISVVLAAGLLSSVIVAPTAAASDGGETGVWKSPIISLKQK